MGTKRMRTCFNCGEQIGESEYYDRFDTCGARECDREAQRAFREMEEDRAERAREDNYERY